METPPGPPFASTFASCDERVSGAFSPTLTALALGNEVWLSVQRSGVISSPARTMASPATTSQRPSESGGRMAGEYRLLRKLGEGAFGAVYEAEHPLLKRKAAVKVLHRLVDRQSDAVLRFVSEAQAVNQIKSRHIVDVFSFGKLNDGRHFYVMDLLDGEPLDRWLKRQGRLDVATALQLLTPIAGALDLAHGAGIVHRDLKPQNIFLAWDASGETVPKLLDFGMAKLLGDSQVHTVSGTPIGTPLYMSPEQARGAKVDRRSDVYALGVLAFEMLTGKLPIIGDTTVAVLMAHIMETPPRPSELCAEVSPLLDAPLLRMLAKNPEDRPESAGDAVAALREAARTAGERLTESALRLPKPEPQISGELQRGGEPDTLLDDVLPSDRPLERSRIGTARRPWPLAIGIASVAALLGGVALLRQPPAPVHPEPSVSASDQPPSAVPPAPSAVPSAEQAAERSPVAPAPSGSDAPKASAAVPSASATPRSETSKSKPRPAGSSHIPRDLESPF